MYLLDFVEILGIIGGPVIYFWGDLLPIASLLDQTSSQKLP